jgi:putative cell wall-binding protein
MHMLRARRTVALVLAAALVVGGIVAAPAYAIGVGITRYDSPANAANDHTPVWFTFTATSGLAANTDYKVKALFMVGSTPSAATDRGWTWNPTTGVWAQAADAWSSFPTVTTDAQGRVLNAGVFTKVGDERITGGRKLGVVLYDPATATAYNPSAVADVTVLDMDSNGSWVHNGTDTDTSGLERAQVSVYASPLDCLSLTLTEPNLVDDDADFAVDNEDYGPAGFTGDYRLAVPAGTDVDVFLSTTNQQADEFATGPGDVDLAIGTPDQIAPSPPASIDASAGTNTVAVSWTASTDAGGSGLAGYLVYRWQKDADAAPYTNPHTVLASVAATATSYVDDEAENGVEYGYEVRAIDGATNVSARSPLAFASPVGVGETARLAGGSRYATALAISRATFANGSVDTVVVATGADYPDALAASGLAGVYESPLLLVGDTVTIEFAAEVSRLGATEFVIVGGTKVVSLGVETELKKLGDVTRVAGSNRYDTAAKVAHLIDDEGGFTEQAFFVRGDNYADALAVAPFAWRNAMPVLLVRPTEVPPETESVIASLTVDVGYVAGGPSAVSDATLSALDGMVGSSVDRIFGANRYATATEIAEYAVGEGWAEFGYIGIATGLHYADALGGGAAAGANGGVMLLTDPNTLSKPVEDLITAKKLLIDDVVIFGGTSAVSDAVKTKIESLLP